MDDVPLSVLFTVLGLLLVCSAFFSSSETALMSLNRYRLRHRARAGVRSARMAEVLLAKPDRLIGLILIGNNIVNIGAAQLATLIALRLGGGPMLAASTGILTFVVLIFAEVAPKTLAALYPERVATPAVYVYYPLLHITKPVSWIVAGVNLIANVARAHTEDAQHAVGVDEELDLELRHAG
ncbi:MAG: CNNM domain-containing protein, partial [Pseudomonadota bacterium]